MRRLITGIAVAALAASSAVPAFAKAHMQPSDRAQELGQANANALDPTGARNADARMLIPGTDGGAKGVDGKVYSDLRREVKGTESGLKSGDMVDPSRSRK